MHKREAFTLVELWVVIAIIAFQLSVILAALRSAKDRAKLTICVFHQQRIMLALQTCQASYGDYTEHLALFKTAPKGIAQWWDSPEMMA